MPASQIVARMVEHLRSLPGLGVPAAHIGRTRPADDAAQLPALVVLMAGSEDTPAGIGGWISASRQSGSWVEKRGTRTSGLLTIEAWGAGSAAADLSDAVSQALAGWSGAAAAGFLLLREREVQPAEAATPETSESRYRAALIFRVLYEEVAAEDSSGGGPIQQIQVEIDDRFDEHFEIP